MLSKLLIQNFVLIEALTLDFHSGFTVITGETGAGKSILLGALSLIMGQRSDTSVIRQSCERCVIEAYFTQLDSRVKQVLQEEDIDCEDDELIIRRELTSKGKNRVFINDSPSTLAILKKLSDFLIDIHSQHKNLLLGDAHFQLSVLDLYCENHNERQGYKDAYSLYRKAEQALREAQEQALSVKQEEEFLRFQYTQLAEADLKEGELTQLEEEERTLQHALDIRQGLSAAYRLLEEDEQACLPILSQAYDALRSIDKYWTRAGELGERLQSVRWELRDVAQTLSQTEEQIDYNPERLSIVSERLNLLNKLLSKYRCATLLELISLRNSYKARLELIGNSTEYIRGLEEELAQAYQKLQEAGDELSQTRRKSAQSIETILTQGLQDIGMPYASFLIKLEKRDIYTSEGVDMVTFLFSANKNIDLEPVAEIASGGEISRLMLCLKALIADRRALPSIIFDEIDTGVSGDTAERIGTILQRMSKDMQVMAVTHLPQIAASGKQHIYVYKEHGLETSQSHIRYLTQIERTEEIARMQSGSTLSATSLAAARELLGYAQRRLSNETN